MTEDFCVPKFYPITRYRNILTQDYINEEVRTGSLGYYTFKEAELALARMDTDDSDYEILVCIHGKWFATRDGKVTISRSIP